MTKKTYDYRKIRGFTREVLIMWLLIVTFVAALGAWAVWRDSQSDRRIQNGAHTLRFKSSTSERTSSDRAIPVFHGTGSAMIAPLYGALCAARTEENPKLSDTMTNYTPTGSEEGLRLLNAGNAYWVATERPLPLYERLEMNVFQFPVLLAGLAVTANLPGIESGRLKLSRKNLIGIFLGRVKRWDDPDLQIDNANLKLPNIPIVVLYKDKGSGTNFILTHYLSAISKEWRKQVGAGTTVKWPTGRQVADDRELIEEAGKVVGALACIESSQALAAGLSLVQMENGVGEYVLPSRKTIEACLPYFTEKDFDDYTAIQSTIPGKACYPLVGVNYTLLKLKSRSNFQDAMRAAEFWEFANWCFENNELSGKLGFHFVFFPRNIVKLTHDLYYERGNGFPSDGAR